MSPDTIYIEFKVGTKTNTIELCDVKHVPDMPNNLISIGCLTDKGSSATFTSTGVEFKTWARAIVSGTEAWAAVLYEGMGYLNGQGT